MQTNYRLILTTIFASFVIFACGDSNQPTNANDHGSHDSQESKTVSDQPPSSAVTLKDDRLNAVYQHYTHLTTALVNGDASEARIAANAIEAGAKQLENGAAIAGAASRIVESSDIEKQRSEYSRLSDEMITLVKKAGVGSGELYVDYCPMAMDDKGAYWLATKKEIVNPYFGNKMLSCGEVKETIR